MRIREIQRISIGVSRPDDIGIQLLEELAIYGRNNAAPAALLVYGIDVVVEEWGGRRSGRVTLFEY